LNVANGQTLAVPVNNHFQMDFIVNRDLELNSWMAVRLLLHNIHAFRISAFSIFVRPTCPLGSLEWSG
jgi:hypothetical protein